MVELAVDAASDRLLAKLSQNRRSADSVGRRKSAAVGGRADRHHDHRSAGARAPEPDALVSRRRFSQILAELRLARPRGVPLPILGLALFLLPGTGPRALRFF